MSEAVGHCAVCQVEAKQFCSACKKVTYCSAEHQRAHWKKHKHECRCYKIAQNDELGRFLLVTRNIKADEVIFTEQPLVVGPQWFTPKKGSQQHLIPCVGCFEPCRIDRFQCQRCKWPTCSPSCSGLLDPNMHAVECSVLRLGPGPSGKSLEARMDYFRTEALFVLKCLMLQTQDPKRWALLMDMQSHEEDRFSSELYKEADERIVNYLEKNYLGKKKDKLPPECGRDVLHKICGIIETNYMCINLPSGLEMSGLFFTACMMEHTCTPNCYFRFDNHNGFRISVVAGREIRKDEHLHIMYSNMLWSTHMRHEHLMITKHFVCKCDRCRDPTEFGTYLSGLICVGDVNKQCGGIQLPKDPLTIGSVWACNKCPVQVESDHVRFLLSNVIDDVNEILEKKPTVQQLEHFIEMLSYLLHPNHCHLFTLKHTLVQLYGTEPGYLWHELSDEQIQKKLRMCDEMLAVCDTLDPHTIKLSIYVAILLHEVQRTLKEQGKRLTACIPRRTDEAMEKFAAARTYLNRATKVLARELDTVTGSKLNDAVENAGFDLDALIACAI